MAEHSQSNPSQAGYPPDGDPDAVIDRLTALVERDVGEGDFYREVLQDLVTATGGLGAALWIQDTDGLRLRSQNGFSYTSEPVGDHSRCLEEAIAGRQCRAIQGVDRNAVEILCPCQIDEDTVCVLQLRQESDVSKAALTGQERFVSIVGDLIAVYHRNRRLAAAGGREEQWRQVDRFVQVIHRPIDLDATAYEIANEGRRLVGCDRVTVLIRRRKRWQVLAVSGTDVVNRRSAAVAHLELLASLVAVENSAVWSGSAAFSAPPELETALDDYHDCSSARLIGLVPLSVPLAQVEDDGTRQAEPFGLLVFERFDQVEPEGMHERCDAVCRHSAGALHHCLTNDEMPLRRLSRFLGRFRWVNGIRQQPWAVLGLAASIVVLVVLSLVQVPLRVEATGALQPGSRRHLFAPSDGVVEQLYVGEAGRPVVANEELIRLRDPELQFEKERVLGELQTARKQLAGIEAERLHTDRASRSDLREAAKRSAEEESLKKLIEGHERQQALLETREESLHVRSPIQGRVLSWDVEQLLRARPVRRGQILLTVANLEDPWVLELEIPDDQIADVTEALRARENPLTVRFILATAPEKRYEGVLEEVALATDVRSGSTPTVSAIVTPENQDAMRLLRPGASVVAKIDCGRRSALYVMFRGLLRAIQTHILF